MSHIPPNHLIPSGGLGDELLAEAVKRFGSPIFVYDSAILKSAWFELKGALPLRARLLYSVKANPSLALLQILSSLGAGFEVASIGELAAVRRIGGDLTRTVLVGPAKTDADLMAARDAHVVQVVVESVAEFQRLATIVAQAARPVHVALRINPGLPKLSLTGRRSTLAMGGRTQFGMDPTEALDLLNARVPGNIKITGIHAYLGTRILDPRVIVANTGLILDTAAWAEAQSGQRLEFIDAGGGFGVASYQHEEPLDLLGLLAGLNEVTLRYTATRPWLETLAFEAGRFVVARAGAFVCRVVDVKEREDHCFVMLDGGLTAVGGRDAYAGARPMPIRVLASRDMRPLTVCGPLCTPTDRLAADVILPQPSVGDLVVSYHAGAYGLTASPGMFLSRDRPAEVLYHEGELLEIRTASLGADALEGQRLIGG